MISAKLKTIDADTLINKVYDKEVFLVDEIIPFGLTLFCGRQKIGKSWFVLDLCIRIAGGEQFLGFPTTQCGVLYMCLEDTMARIQRRIFRITDKVSDRLRFTNEVHKIKDGLLDYLENYVREYPDTGLIVIDTLQKIRCGSSENMYAHDYNDLSALKYFADKHHVAIILVHHRRKQDDPDIENTVSGSTGLTGCADTTLILDRAQRGSNAGKLNVNGRDVENQTLELRMVKCRWELTGRKTQKQEEEEKVPEAVQAVVCLLAWDKEWKGTASELCKAIGYENVDPPVLAKQLNQFHSTYLADHNVIYSTGRTHEGRFIHLLLKPDEPAPHEPRDGSDSSDGKYGIYRDEAAVTPEPAPFPEVAPQEDAPS